MLRTLWRGSRVEAAVLPDDGRDDPGDRPDRRVPVGMIAAFVYVVYELSRLNVRPVPLRAPRKASVAGEPRLPVGAARRGRGAALLRLGLPPAQRPEPRRRLALPGDRPGAGAVPRHDRRRDPGGGRRVASPPGCQGPAGAAVRRGLPSAARGHPGDLPRAAGDARSTATCATPSSTPRPSWSPMASARPAARSGRCATLEHGPRRASQALDRTPVPRVRAVVTGDGPRPSRRADVRRGRPGRHRADGARSIGESVRPGPLTSWNRRGTAGRRSPPRRTSTRWPPSSAR